VPDFYSVASLEGITIQQGELFIDRPHYDRNEQILCVNSGVADFYLMPHVYRQELEAGKFDEQKTYYSESDSKQERETLTAVNLAFPMYGKYIQ